MSTQIMPLRRKKLIAGNWKMNLTVSGARVLAQAVRGSWSGSDVDVAICPAFVHLETVRDVLRGSAIGLGAQDVYFEPNGAFTGEVSVAMLADLGCRFVILGHSERRNILGETSEQVDRKAHAVIAQGLSAIVCVGETLEQRDSGSTREVVCGQMAGSLAGIDIQATERLVIAYEPVWAIGTGRTATPAQAQEVHVDLRNWLSNRYNSVVAAGVRILYGGSVKPDNAAELMGQTDIDGALVGGASLQADGFAKIIGGALRAASY